MLLARPKMLPDECAVSYLIRVSERNGFRNIGHLLHHAGLPWKNNRAPVHQILTGRYEIAPYLDHLGLQYVRPKSAGVFSKFRRVIDVPNIFVKFPKICPQCLEELGYCKTTWAYLPMLACNRHKTMLVDTHKQSGIHLGWYREKLDRFDCDDKPAHEHASVASSAICQISRIFEGLIENGDADVNAPSILRDIGFREVVSIFHFLAHYSARLEGEIFRPVVMENCALAERYKSVWIILKSWPDSFYSMLSQYIDNPMSQRGVAGINKHYRDLHECLNRQKENEGIARVKQEFDRYIEVYWPGTIESGHITRIAMKSTLRGVITKKEAASIIGCRPERIDKFVQMKRLTRVIFKGKAQYLRDEVEVISNQISSNWSMSEACRELQLSRYQLKLLLDAELIPAIQRSNDQNRDWIVDRRGAIELVFALRRKAEVKEIREGLLTTQDTQRMGYSIVSRLRSMLVGELEFNCEPSSGSDYSLKQFTRFRFTRKQALSLFSASSSNRTI